jgi:hypothetical protein
MVMVMGMGMVMGMDMGTDMDTDMDTTPPSAKREYHTIIKIKRRTVYFY